MNILFITHEYYPNPSAITNCLNPIINNLIESNKVFVLTRNDSNNLLSEEVINSVNIYRVRDEYHYFLEKRECCNNNILKFYYKIRFHLLYKKYKKSINDGFFSLNKMIKKGKRIIESNKIDIIISCSFPFTSHVIASKIKNKYTKWIAYQFDPYTYNYTLLSDGKSDFRLKSEIDILSRSDKIFITEENYNENLKTELKLLKEKYKVLPYPLIAKPNLKIKCDKEKILLTFAGTLYNNIREPFKMLEILSRLNLNFEIHLYYFADEIITSKLKSYQFQNLFLHYKKSKKECDMALANSNFILNIGNAMLNQTPSKVFEIISLGKPIINFYTNNSDTSKNILKKYKLVYNIDTNKFNNYNELKKFILENKTKSLTFEEATKNYIKQEEAVNIIVKEVIDINEDR